MYESKNSKKKILGSKIFKKPKNFYINIGGGGGASPKMSGDATGN